MNEKKTKTTQKNNTKTSKPSQKNQTIVITSKAMLGSVELSASSEIKVNENTTPQELLSYWEKLLITITALSDIQTQTQNKKEQ